MSEISQVALAPGAILGGDFRIVRPLSEGGMGAVYVAEQISTRKQRALKVMHPRLVPDARSRERFREEASVGSRIPSEHVVEVIAAGVDEPTGVPWLAMELLEGMDLDRVVREQSPLPHRVVSEILAQVGHALRAAHAQGIVHRDLKPENLFAARSRRSDASMTIKVLDFGIAKTVADAKTAATVTTAIGSPLWMAPEQGTPGAQLRPSTDVWALGLIAFYLLTERYYWTSANLTPIALQALLVDVMVSPIVPASVRAAELGRHGRIPAGFDGWFARCVTREPSQRFAEAGAAVDALRAILAGSPSVHDGRTAVLAHPPPPSIPATVVAPSPGSRLGLWIGLAGVAIAALGITTVFAFVDLGSEAPSAPPMAISPVRSVVPEPLVVPPVERPVAVVDPPVAPAELPPEVIAQIRSELEARRDAGAGQREAPPRRAIERAAPAPRAASTDSSSGQGGNIDDLLGRALGPGASRPRASTPSDSSLRETPSRGDVVSAMTGVSGSVAACGQGEHGTATVAIVFAGSSGRVTSANVTGQFAGTPVGSCIARAVRAAHVPPFRAATSAVNYPFRL